MARMKNHLKNGYRLTMPRNIRNASIVMVKVSVVCILKSILEQAVASKYYLITFNHSCFRFTSQALQMNKFFVNCKHKDQILFEIHCKCRRA